MAAKSEKRVFADYYTRYDGKRIYVVRVVQDIDTGVEIIVCKDASFRSREMKNITPSQKPLSVSRSK